MIEKFLFREKLFEKIELFENMYHKILLKKEACLRILSYAIRELLGGGVLNSELELIMSYFE